ncbi:MAG: aldo/keto reductase, partial [Pseudomonadota bacterium]
MEMRQLGRTDLQVSSCCLGTMTWGQQNTEAEGHAQMDYALERGVNFWDTAEMYSIPPSAETQGSTERIIGTWLQKTERRQDVVLATKIVGRSKMLWTRNDELDWTRQTKTQVDEALFKSLERLQTDYVDLYQLHWPDRIVGMFGADMDPSLYKVPYEPFDEILA